MIDYEDKKLMRVDFPATNPSLYHSLKHLALAMLQSRIIDHMAHAFNLI